MRVYIGIIVHCASPTELSILEGGAVVVNDKGVIEALHAAPLPTWDADWKIHDLGRRLLVPGLIDTHIHAPQYAQLGLGTDLPLLQWLERYTFPTEARFAEVSWAKRVYGDVVRRTLRLGTTTAVYFASLHVEASAVLADTCAALGQHAFVGKVCMDRHGGADYCERDAAHSLADTRRFVAHCRALNSPHVAPVITPRFAITCTPELLRGLAAVATEHDLLVQTHLDENAAEIAFTAQLFPEARDYASVYADAGLLRPGRAVLAHVVHATDAELDTLRRTGAGVAHCPRSNLTLGSGLCRVRRLQQHGIPVALGTDASGGPSISMWDAMRAAVDTSHAVHFSHGDSAPLSYCEAFHLATQGGADVLGLGAQLGSLHAGKLFNAVVLDPAALDCYGLETAADLFQKCFYGADDRTVEQVYVWGRRVV